MSRITAALIALVTLTPAALSQNGPLLGFTANPAAPSTKITRQVLCDPPTVVCRQALPAPTTDYAGGAAYSPMRDSIWHTEGTRLTELELDSCLQTCSVPAALVLGARSLVGGLTIDPVQNALRHVESIPGLGAVVTYGFGPTAPCPVQKTACRFPLPTADHFAGAIAYDGRREIVYVATSIFGVAAPDNVLLLFKGSDPNCDPFCRIQVPNCLTGKLQSIRAMAYDECEEMLYISDGRQTSAQRVIWPAGSGCPILRPVACCSLNSPFGEFWAGFDVLPDAPRPVGFSCTPAPSCPSCPAMGLDTVGMPVIGNASFAFRIHDAPTSGTGYLLLNVGPCVGVPFGCGRLYPSLNPAPVALGPVALGGVGACGGGAQFPLGIPANYALCGLSLCAQGIVLCPAGGIGLTNGVEIVIDS